MYKTNQELIKENIELKKENDRLLNILSKIRDFSYPNDILGKVKACVDIIELASEVLKSTDEKM